MFHNDFIIDTDLLLVEVLKTAETLYSVGTLTSNISSTELSFSVDLLSNVATPVGTWLWKIGNEIIAGYFRGSTFSVDTEHTRALFSSTVGGHSSGASISLASVADTINGRVYLNRTPSDFKNIKPCIVMSKLGELNESDNPKLNCRYQFKIYGGEDNEKLISLLFPKILASAFKHKAKKIKNLNTDFGILGGIKLDGEQTIINDLVRPEWPYASLLGNVYAV